MRWTRVPIAFDAQHAPIKRRIRDKIGALLSSPSPVVEYIRAARVKGRHTRTCKGTFKSFKLRDTADEENQRLDELSLTWLVIDARDRINGGTLPFNPLFG